MAVMHLSWSLLLTFELCWKPCASNASLSVAESVCSLYTATLLCVCHRMPFHQVRANISSLPYAPQHDSGNNLESFLLLTSEINCLAAFIGNNHGTAVAVCGRVARLPPPWQQARRSYASTTTVNRELLSESVQS